MEDERLLDAEGAPEPDVIAREIADDLRGGQIEEIPGDVEAAG